MGKTNTSIKLNGKHYDIISGKPLGQAVTAHTSRKDLAKPVAITTKPRLRDDVIRTVPAHHTPHAPKPAKTLMRQSVKKPSLGTKTTVKVQASTDHLAAKPLGSIVRSHSIGATNQDRLKRAHTTPKSQHVQRFPKHHVTTAVPSIIATEPPAQQASKPVSEHPHTTAEIFERAMHHATSHEQPAHKPKKRHSKLGIISTSALVVAVIAALGTQAVPQIQTRIASARAGFNVSLPNYKPAGYSLSTLDYSSGQAVSHFTSNSSDRSYTVSQRTSTWDSAALRESFVAPTDATYQTVESGGRTIFLYGKHSATWVNGGIWYQIQSDGTLSDQDLVRLATSL